MTPSPTPDPRRAIEEALKKQRESLEKQIQSIRSQVGEKVATTKSSSAVEQFITPLISFNPLPVSQPDCPSIDNAKLNDIVTAAAQKQSLAPSLLKAVIKQESGFKPCAVSVKGAQGLMQLMPATARELHVTNAFDPSQNIHAGAAYLKQLLNRYNGDLRLALVGYNAGPARADEGLDSAYPIETQNYVAGILADLGLDQEQSDEASEDLAPAEATSAPINTVETDVPKALPRVRIPADVSLPAPKIVLPAPKHLL